MYDRFQRDPGVLEIIQYYENPERCDWSMLTVSETNFLHSEIKRCMESFEYFARNYCWITTKDMEDIPLRLKPTQELMLETINRLKAKGRGVKLLIIKARQLFASTLIESYIAWLAMFSPNANALVLSYDDAHAAFLFSIILHIYDKLPWWLRPMIGQRKYQEELQLINPNPELRAFNPGMNTRIVAEGARKYAGVAEGYRINFSHISELGSMDPSRARSIVFGDLRWALPDHASTFAVIESRVKKGAKFLEKLWESSIEMGDVATWYPLFLPIYFDRSHFISPEAGWKPLDPELAIKKRASEEWCICSGCSQIRPAVFGGEQTSGLTCKDCKTGSYQPYTLEDGQMRWLWEQRENAQRISDQAVMDMQQSLATNPQEAFQYVTETVFSKAAMDQVSKTVLDREPEAVGYMTADGQFHAPRRISGSETAICWSRNCQKNHVGEPERFLKIWEMPRREAKYSMGFDVASGEGGRHDYSVIWINRVATLPNPDVQVACFRSNTVRPMEAADVANALGRLYNNALAVTDYTNLQTAGDRLRIFHKYPNVYRWKRTDADNMLSHSFHWIWNEKNKNDAWMGLDSWLRDGSLIVRDPVFAREMRHFQRNDNGKVGAPQSKEESFDGGDTERVHDDTITACELAVFGYHQLDFRRQGQGLPVDQSGLKSTGEWSATCTRCGLTWHRDVYSTAERCPIEGCRSIFVRWHHNLMDKPKEEFSFYDMANDPSQSGDGHFGQCQDLVF